MDGGIRHYKRAARLRSEGATGYLTIDLTALCRNYHTLSAQVSPARSAAVVKADAYGLGATQVAAALYGCGCRDFFVAQFDEAVRLRPSVPADASIFVLNGLQPGNELRCAGMEIVPVLNSLDQMRRWKSMARSLGRRLPAVLQFDTGMSRLGIPASERPVVSAELAGDTTLDILFVMSHLASADEADSVQNADQLAEMQAIARAFPAYPVCFANSGGIFLGAEYHGLLVRPGIALYGGISAPGNGLQPVVRLDVAVVQTRTVPAGTPVGYGGAHVTAGERRLATIAAGYADGLPRSLGDRGAVFCDGIRLPIVGRVSMDSITIDVTALPEGTLRPGSLVEVLGPHQSLEDLAKDAGTISYEILTGLGRRYVREYC